MGKVQPLLLFAGASYEYPAHVYIEFHSTSCHVTPPASIYSATSHKRHCLYTDTFVLDPYWYFSSTFEIWALPYKDIKRFTAHVFAIIWLLTDTIYPPHYSHPRAYQWAGSTFSSLSSILILRVSFWNKNTFIPLRYRTVPICPAYSNSAAGWDTWAPAGSPMTMTLHYLSYATCSAKLQYHSSTNKRISPSRTPLIVIHVRIGASLIQMSTLQRQLYRGPFTLREAREAASFIFQQVRTQCSASLPVFSTQFHPTQNPPEVKPHLWKNTYTKYRSKCVCYRKVSLDTQNQVRLHP